MNLNVWAVILLALQVLGIVLAPFTWGKSRGENGWGRLIGSIIGLVVLLLAFGLQIRISY